jgi:hypothetical protein
MRYYTIAYPTDNGDVTETLSEEDIRRDYWPYWYGRMCEKFSKEHVDKTYSFEDCLDDWVVLHWAEEQKECPWNNWRPNREV